MIESSIFEKTSTEIAALWRWPPCRPLLAVTQEREEEGAGREMRVVRGGVSDGDSGSEDGGKRDDTGVGTRLTALDCAVSDRKAVELLALLPWVRPLAALCCAGRRGA